MDACGVNRLSEVMIESCRQRHFPVTFLAPAREGYEHDGVPCVALPHQARHLVTIEAGHADVQ